jgi:hypothetical protein
MERRGEVMENKIIVQSFAGLWDEESEARLYNIANRKRCLHHNFVNASLLWEPTKSNPKRFSIKLESPKSEFTCEWGVGYGGIRLCSQCKTIDCIHLWDNDKAATYIVQHGPFYEEHRSVDTCRICGRRIARSGCGVSKPSDDSQRIIAEEYMALNGREFNPWAFGSGWSIEFPVYVSRTLASGGEAAAREAVRRAFISGDISGLMGKLS